MLDPFGSSNRVPMGTPPASSLDLIGDIHGCAALLERLLERLGYSIDGNGVWCHPLRKAVFLGDIIDRGPQIRESVTLVRRMVEHGAAYAILGNHEINALRACRLEARLRHSRQRRVLKETLEQYTHYQKEWESTLDWFAQLPLCLEMAGMRAIHACWDERLMRPFLKQQPDGRLTPEQLHRCLDPQSFYFDLVDRATRGPQLNLPGNLSIHGRDGVQRKAFRTSFWHAHPHVYGDVVFQPDPLPDCLEERVLKERELNQLVYYAPNQCPLFFGHYWRSGRPSLLAPNIACLDYSAVKGGLLVAYRYDGEQHLSAERLVWQSANDSMS